MEALHVAQIKQKKEAKHPHLRDTIKTSPAEHNISNAPLIPQECLSGGDNVRSAECSSGGDTCAER